MEEVNIEVENVSSLRPSLEQMKAIVNFMEKHRNLATAKLRDSFSRQQSKRLWPQLSNIVNSIPGASKTTQGWMRFWIDKKCMIKGKKKQIDLGKQPGVFLSPIEEKIWQICFEHRNNTNGPRRKKVKQEVSDDDDSNEDLPLKRKCSIETIDFNEQPIPDPEERQIVLMEKLVQVMEKQSSALTQLAKSTLTNAQAMERIAEASQLQARAVDRLATSFEAIRRSVHDVRTAIINIDYTLKRVSYPNQT